MSINGESLDPVELLEAANAIAGRHGVGRVDPGLARRCVSLQTQAQVPMSDITALGALSEARVRGIHVPGELSIVGFDDIPETRWSQPALTTVSQATEAKGRLAARLLLDLIAGTARPDHIMLQTRLVVRESVGRNP